MNIPDANSKMRLITVVSQPFAENTYIAYFEGRDDCIIIDPGMEPDKIFSRLDAENLKPAAILDTHGHSDHIAGNAACKHRWPDCPLVIGAGDAAKLTDPMQNLSSPFGFEMVSPAADRLVRDGDVVSAAGFDLEVLETPGHSAGHVVYAWKGSSPWVVFCGDLIFQDSIGRTDFPDGSLSQLVESVHNKLFTMPDDTILLSGHGAETTVGQEKRTNPFVGGEEYPG